MKKVLTVVCLLTLAVSCSKIFVYDEIDTVVYFLSSGTVSLRPNATTYDVVVYRGGLSGAPTANISVDKSIVDNYNTENGTSFSCLPEECYSIPASAVKIDEALGAAHCLVSLKLDSLPSGSWMLPLKLTSSEVKVNDKKNVLILILETK
jgi:hypothetical protein